MTGKRQIAYRANIRLNKVEYADVIQDIESLPENERPARLRLLLRLGHAALHGMSFPSPVMAGIPKVVSIGSANSLASANHSAAPQPKRTRGLDGLDVADFKFGTPS